MFTGQEAKPHGAKKGIDIAGASRRRQEMAISLRAKKREEMIQKKRKESGKDEQENVVAYNPEDPFSYNVNTSPHLVPVALLPAFMQLVFSDISAHQYQGTLMIRKLLSVETKPPIEQVIHANVAPRFVQFMQCDNYPQLQFESCWALTNLASGTQENTFYVVSHNAIPGFMHLLASPDEDCREQATWGIGNIAGDCANTRDACLALGVMEPLLHVATSPCGKISVLRNSVWALSNLCRSKPNPDLEQVAVALPVLAWLLNNADDEVVMDAAWAISYISDGANDRIQRVLQAGVLPRIVQLLASASTAMQTPAIRTIGNVVTGNDAQTQVVVNAGALPAMHFLLEHPKRGIKKEACWTLSNITAGNRDQIQAVINAGLIPPLLKCLRAQEFEVKKEAVWAVANLTCGGSAEQVRYVVDVGALDPLCELLSMFDVKIVGVALEALENILHFGEEERTDRNLEKNPYAEAILQNGGYQKVEDLQGHSNNEVYQTAMNILDTFFDVEETMPALAPVDTESSGFAFNTAPNTGGQGFPGFKF